MEKVTTREFFNLLFEGLDGYLALLTIDRSRGKKVEQQFFEYPGELDEALVFIDKVKMKMDVYFAPFLTTHKRRRKEDIAETPVVWADGDDCPIDQLQLQPTAVIRTSEGRYAYFWKFHEIQTPDVGESISKRVAYYHEADGMDTGGWDLTQVLRIPDTYNHKYTPPQQVSHAVVAPDALYLPEDFSVYPVLEDTAKLSSYQEANLPDKTAEEILNEYKNKINPRALTLFSEVPREDWSKTLWELELTLIEAGMSVEEAFIIARDSACNKYKRDGRPDGFLWKEVQRAALHVEKRQSAPPELAGTQAITPPELLTDKERDAVEQDKTFVEEYVAWAKTLGDAAVQYHPAGAFVILSSLMSNAVTLPTSFGTVLPNLWFMILADTTLTRKSTAMDNATDLLMEVDSDILLATDGSVEGLLTALAGRPGRTSLFLRDEVTGLIEAMSRKDYLSGMMETLTKLYDGKHMKRILRRETIDVKDPVLVLFSGGIRNKMMDLLDFEHVSSGFLPRFIFITAEADITRLKPIGPPTKENLQERTLLLRKCKKMYERYAKGKASTDGTSVHIPKQWVASLDEDAWILYNTYEIKMVQFALEGADPSLLTPMMDRLAKSGLKAAVLIAASRMEGDEVIVTCDDLRHAFYYIEQWIEHTMYIIANIGTSQDERKLQKILHQIENNPGVLRSKLMQGNYLTAREADNLFATLEQRNAIKRESKGARGERLYPFR